MVAESGFVPLLRALGFERVGDSTVYSKHYSISNRTDNETTTNNEASTGSNTGTGNEASTSNEADACDDAKINAIPEANTNIEVDKNIGANGDTNTEINTCTDTESNASKNTETGTNTSAEVDASKNIETGTDTNAETSTGTNIDVDKNIKPNTDIEIKVDFATKKIIYPQQIDTGKNTTTNFSQDENMVVLECVCALLEKGYLPETIFLEKEWTLGHTGKGGRADITVIEKNGSDVLFIIECKTAGREYIKARKELKEGKESDAAKQLFSYAAQARSCKWLMLYASKYNANSGKIERYDEIIRSHDDKNILTLAEKSPNDGILLYKNASQAEDLCTAWRETYHGRTYHGLILGQDALPYQVGVKPLRKRDLKQLTKDDNVSLKFREILRHNVISDKENAFNKLLSLFICKMVDEKQCKDDDIVGFQYKYGVNICEDEESDRKNSGDDKKDKNNDNKDGKDDRKDTEDDYYSLYERLLQLYHDGMLNYLGEDVFYLDNSFVHKTIEQYTGQNRAQLEKELTKKFRDAKLLSCQVFAFQEIYNEKLFLQNGKVLVEMVELLQTYRISYSSKEQLLGDLFEQLLGQGFKQDEGQFFTPIPITRFVWNSLPYERFVDKERQAENKSTLDLKVIDFACGAGHFLTEGISAVKEYLQSKGRAITDSDLSYSFYGVDKDNRLAKVSKVALFLNGAEQARIKAMDGLEHDEHFLDKRESFDLVATNPPFSVDSFKAHLPKAVQDNFEVLKHTTTSSGDIQNAFVERLVQLLKPLGVVGIIMPSSFLNAVDDGKNVARAIMLQNFFIRAIVCLADKTFGQTGTSVNILFLQKFDEPPKRWKVVEDSVNAILNPTLDKERFQEWEDNILLREYLKLVGAERQEYFDFVVKGKKTLDEWRSCKSEYLRQYVQAFDKSGYADKLIKDNDRRQPKYKKTPDDLAREIQQKFIDGVRGLTAATQELNNTRGGSLGEKATEWQKLYYFALVYRQKTLVITAPKDSDAQKRFLGYVNSNAKGQKALTETEGLLTDAHDRNSNKKLAFVVKHTFMGDTESILATLDPSLAPFVKYYDLKNMLTFTNPTFANTIRTALPTTATAHKQSKWQMVRLGDYIQENEKSDFQVNSAKNNKTGEYPFFTSGANVYRCDTFLTDGKNIFLSTGGNAIIKLYDGKASYSTDTWCIKSKSNNLLTAYLFEYLNKNVEVIDEFYFKGIGLKHLQKDDFRDISLPLPPLAVQEKIVAECEAIDGEYTRASEQVKECEAGIAALFEQVDGERVKLGEVCIEISGNQTKIEKSEILESGKYPVVTQETGRIIAGYTNNANAITDVPLVVFGDHSCTFKYIDFPFVRGADGTQLIKTDENTCKSKYVYYILSNTEIKNAGYYERHFKYLKDISFPLPPLAVQKELVQKAEVLEKQAADARSVMANCAPRKKAILEREL